MSLKKFKAELFGKKKFSLSDFNGILIAIDVIFITLLIGSKVLSLEVDKYQFTATSDCCCEGDYCTSTYYDFDNKNCVIVSSLGKEIYDSNCSKEWKNPKKIAEEGLM